MRDISYFNKIYLAVQPVDFRKAMHGLSLIVQQVFKISVFEGRVLFVFINKKKNSIRILYWDQTGFALWSKLLEKDKFRWPKDKQATNLSVTSSDLKWLLQGVDLAKIKTHDKVNLTVTY